MSYHQKLFKLFLLCYLQQTFNYLGLLSSFCKHYTLSNLCKKCWIHLFQWCTYVFTCIQSGEVRSNHKCSSSGFLPVPDSSCNMYCNSSTLRVWNTKHTEHICIWRSTIVGRGLVFAFSLKFKINDHPAPVQYLPLQVEGDTIAQYGEAEFVFVRSYLVSDDSCWVICDKRISGLLAASPAVDTHFFLPNVLLWTW